MGKVYDKLRHCKARARLILQRPSLLRVMDASHRTGELKDMPEDTYRHWRRSFSRLMLSTYLIKTELMPQFFASAKISVVHKGEKPLKPNDVIAVGVFKDVLIRVRMFIEHGRQIGIDRFAILDNGSAEDVISYLSAQSDVDLYHTDDAFQTIAKDSWINRILSYYGPGRWYFQLDSDELPAYFGMREKSIHAVVDRLDALGYSRASGIMLDMYGKGPLFQQYSDGGEIRASCRYFDPASYIHTDTFGIKQIKGGPRYRLFGDKQMLTKCPLYKLRDVEIVIDSHFQWPYADVRRAPCMFALLHYKYIMEDKAEYFRRAAKGNFAGGSRAYKAFTKSYQENSEQSFYFDASVYYENEDSLKALDFIQDIFRG